MLYAFHHANLHGPHQNRISYVHGHFKNKNDMLWLGGKKKSQVNHFTLKLKSLPPVFFFKQKNIFLLWSCYVIKCKLNTCSFIKKKKKEKKIINRNLTICLLFSCFVFWQEVHLTLSSCWEYQVWGSQPKLRQSYFNNLLLFLIFLTHRSPVQTPPMACRICLSCPSYFHKQI